MGDVSAWVVWAVLAAVLGIAEVFTLTLVLGLSALAAVVAAVVALLGAPVAAQLVAFILASLGLLLGVRPIAQRHLRNPAPTRTGAAALVGRTGVALARVDGHSGQVKIAGEVWTARSFDDGHVIEPGRRVEVLRIEGATAVVYGSE